MDPNHKNSDAPRGLIILLGATFIVWLISGFGIFFLVASWEKRGQFGDMFGAVNALFSALAFAILIYTMWLQKQELQLQRQELVQTREELARTADAQAGTQRAVELQVELMLIASHVSATATLLESNQRIKSKLAGHYGHKLERMEYALDQRLEELGVTYNLNKDGE